MFSRWFRRAEAPAESPPSQDEQPPQRVYEVGWLFTVDKSSMIWGAPEALRQEASPSMSPKSAAFCPAAIEFDRRHFVVPCPIDVHLKLTITPDGKMNISNLLAERGSVRPGAFNQMFTIMPQPEWRNPQRPVIQLATPYLFVSDDPVYINQFPPFLHYGGAPRPGVQICGRFPIDIWPRILMWAFEWHDLSKDLILKRGEPWFYVRFEGGDPAAQVRLIEAQMTPELHSYAESIADVTNYVKGTFSLFKTARERRPEKLLVPKKR